MLNKPICVLVEAIGVSAQLVESFSKKGYECVHVLSTEAVLPVFKKMFNPTLYKENIYYSKDFKKLLEQISSYKPTCILAGMEPGVNLAEELTESLGLLGNSIEMKGARRNKYVMMKALERQNIPSIPSMKSSDILEVENWINKNNYWPAIVKPIESAGCENVSLCYNNSDLKNVFQKIIGCRNVMGTLNEEVIAQQYLVGVEYIVNSVSCMGRHLITDVWKTQKRITDEGGFVYVVSDLYPSEDDRLGRIRGYLYSVLDALGIKNGPAHAEIMYTDDGPILIEVGARVSGVLNKRLNDELFGFNQADLTADIYTDPNNDLLSYNMPYLPSKCSAHIFLASKQKGKIKSLPFLKEIKKMNSFYSYSSKYEVGDVIPRTIDACTVTGMLTLVNTNKSILEEDKCRVLEFLEEFYDYC